MNMMVHSTTRGFLAMRSRQRILRNLIALIGLGKASVIGAGMALAVVGYADLAKHLLPVEIFDYVVTGVGPEAAASVGGLAGLVVALVVGLFR